MSLADLGKTISKYAPLLGTVIGGAPGGAIGSILAATFGTSDNPQELLAKINADPQAGIKLAEIESNYKVELQRIALQMTEVAAKDTANARASNIQSKSTMPEIISFVVMIGFFLCIWVVVAYKQDSEDHDVLYMMFGSISSAFGCIMQYWFGNSASAKLKDALTKS